MRCSFKDFNEVTELFFCRKNILRHILLFQADYYFYILQHVWRGSLNIRHNSSHTLLPLGFSWYNHSNRGSNSHFPFTVLSPLETNNKTAHNIHYSSDGLTTWKNKLKYKRVTFVVRCVLTTKCLLC